MEIKDRDAADWFMFWFQIITTTIIVTCILLLTSATVFMKYDLSGLVTTTVRETIVQIIDAANSSR